MPSVINAQGAVVRDEAVPAAFSADVAGKANAIFRAVFRERANPRSGTHSTLKRDEVSGGGRKPWKQKGTGRARQGSIRSPQWRHGGVVFGPQPRSYVSSLNKKERRAALIAALSDRFQNGAVTLMQADGFALTKTKEFATLLFGSPKARRPAIQRSSSMPRLKQRPWVNVSSALVRTFRTLRSRIRVPWISRTSLASRA